MKKILWVFAVVFMSVSLINCGDNKPLPFELVGDKLSKTLCDKYETCYKKELQNQTQPSSIPPFDKEKCLKEISTGVADRLKAQSDAKVTKKNIEACKKTIDASGCEILTAESAPTGCEFLK